MEQWGAAPSLFIFVAETGITAAKSRLQLIIVCCDIGA